MEEHDNKGYGKRPLWQWILLYIIIGAVVYGLIYYFAMGKKGGYNSNYKAPSSGYNTNVSPTPSQTTMSSKMTIVLAAENNSGESGTATLQEANGQVTVTLTLTGYPTDATSQPAHIHMGTCPGVGTVKYPLTSIVSGKSTTVIAATLPQLKQQLPLAINVHKSKTDIANYTSCGNLTTK